MDIYAEFSCSTVLVKSVVPFSDSAVQLELPEGYTMRNGEFGWEVLCEGQICHLSRDLNRSGRWEYFVSTPCIDPSTGEYRPPVKLRIIE